MTNELEMRERVAKLPECYQPIFGFPQLGTMVSRQCDDRLIVIRESLQQLVRHYGRPLKVLDLGCAQGFFSMSVADLCGSVLGIDYLAANIDVCNAARDEAGLHHVRFETGEITDVIDRLTAGEFDVVFGLSVFHHLCHIHGWQNIAALLKKLSGVVDVQLLELADAREPLYWAPSLPQDPVDLISQIGFVYPLGSFPTHLGDVERTLFFSSDRLWQLGSNVRAFERWTEQSHEFAGMVHEGLRRYFFASDSVAKTLRFKGAAGARNREALTSEIAFFTQYAGRLGSGFSSPTLISSGTSPDNGYIVTSRIPGRTLGEMLVRNIAFDESEVLRQVIGQLKWLEAHSLYHRDVRVWNVMLDDSGTVHLLDFAAISEQSSDEVWPFDLFASFLIFAGELTRKTIPRVHLFRQPLFSSAWLKEPFRTWSDLVWSHSHREWSFGLFLALLESAQSGSATSSGTQIHSDNWAFWRAVSERLLSDATDAYLLHYEANAVRTTQAEFAATEQHLRLRLAEVDSYAKNLERAVEDVKQRNAGLTVELESATEAHRASAFELDELHRKMAEMQGENDQRLTMLTAELESSRQALIAEHARSRCELDGELARSREQLAADHVRLREECDAELVLLRRELEKLRASTSWRLTAPLRAIGGIVRRK